jgi:hypoxanthine phosphoribosyltransferase
MSQSHTLEVLIDRRKIARAVRRLAREITRDYRDKRPVVVGILTGSFVFLADLIRNLDLPLEVEFVGLSSYGGGTESSGRVKITKRLKKPVTGRHVLIVEDIIDTGLTVSCLLDRLRRENPESIRVCALTDKPSRRKARVNIDYLGFTVPDRFIVGYGIDWDGKYRYLPDICCVETGKKSS